MYILGWLELTEEFCSSHLLLKFIPIFLDFHIFHSSWELQSLPMTTAKVTAVLQLATLQGQKSAPTS